MIFGGGRVHADPKTPSQLRAALAAAQSGTDGLQAAIDALGATVGPMPAAFVSTAAAGQTVYVPASGQVDLADAVDPAKSVVAGLVSTGASSGNSGEYRTGGQLTLSDWTAAAGSATLSAGSVYYSSGTMPGRITTTAPTAEGHTVVVVGRALTTLTLAIAIEPGVLL